MKVGPVIIVAGPTASGKSELGLKLAKRFGGVVVNADSLQVYRELRILTARPDAKSETEVSHRLYGVVPVAERFSVGQWLSMAQHEIDSIHSAGDVPIFVGGTGLYLDGLINGIAGIPEVPAKVRSVELDPTPWQGAKRNVGHIRKQVPQFDQMAPCFV